MNYKKYIDMILLRLSNKYVCVLTEIKKYKEYKKHNILKLIIYKYNKEGDKKKYKSIEAKSERELLLKLKELI